MERSNIKRNVEGTYVLAWSWSSLKKPNIGHKRRVWYKQQQSLLIYFAICSKINRNKILSLQNLTMTPSCRFAVLFRRSRRSCLSPLPPPLMFSQSRNGCSRATRRSRGASFQREQHWHRSDSQIHPSQNYRWRSPCHWWVSQLKGRWLAGSEISEREQSAQQFCPYSWKVPVVRDQRRR